MKQVTIKFRPTGADKKSTQLEFVLDMPTTNDEAVEAWGGEVVHNATIGTSATVQIQAFARRIIKDEGIKKGLATLTNTKARDMLSDGTRKRMTPTERFLRAFNTLTPQEQSAVLEAQAATV